MSGAADQLSDMLEVYVCTKLSEPEINPRRYRRGMTVGDLKNKLEMITGRSAATMALSAYAKDKLAAALDDDDAPLGSYAVESGMLLLVDDPAFDASDPDATDGGYKMTEEEYNAKQVSARVSRRLGGSTNVLIRTQPTSGGFQYRWEGGAIRRNA